MIVHYITLVSVALIAAIGTYHIHTKYKLSPILVSSGLTLLVTMPLNYVTQDHLLIQQIPYIFIGGTFVGMSIKKRIKKPLYILLSAFFYSLVFIKSSQFFEGFGGALGVSACIAVLTIITLNKVFRKSKHYIRKKSSSVA